MFSKAAVRLAFPNTTGSTNTFIGEASLATNNTTGRRQYVHRQWGWILEHHRRWQYVHWRSAGSRKPTALSMCSLASKLAPATQRASATAFRALLLAKPTLPAATTLSRAPLPASPTPTGSVQHVLRLSAGAATLPAVKTLFRAKRLGCNTTGNTTLFWARSLGPITPPVMTTPSSGIGSGVI